MLKRLSESLTEKFEKGFSVDTLEKARKFYQIYKDRISETLLRKFAIEKSATASRIFEDDVPFKLSWSHYIIMNMHRQGYTDTQIADVVDKSTEEVQATIKKRELAMA